MTSCLRRRTRAVRLPFPAHALSPLAACVLGLALLGADVSVAQAFPDYPITPGQRGTARQVAEAGVPLSELAPNAPDSYTIVRGDTLWDISKLFLRSPWRWPELWGMNLDQIRNPHLIYPGQMLVLVKSGGRARLELARAVGGPTQKLSPRVRVEPADRSALSAVPLHLIQPFLNEAVVLETDELERAPRIVAGREGRVLLGRGDVAYVRGDLPPRRDWQVFRRPTPLTDPATGEVLGYEAVHVGSAEYQRPGQVNTVAEGRDEVVPATFNLTRMRQEAGVGDRLAAAPPRDEVAYVPHAPSGPVAGQVVSVYGQGRIAGQYQVVALNRGKRDGMERGHVLALWRAGQPVVDAEDLARTSVRLPDEGNGQMFVFRVFDRVSYALILSALTPVAPGDRYSQP
jgi:LysM domain